MRLPCLPLVISLGIALMAGSAQAGNLSISNVPLGTGSGISVKPNLLFILDDSGSMGWDYTPDWVDSAICQSNMDSFGSTYTCALGDVLYNWSGFNVQYYNPAIRYRPPKNADGSEWANASTSQSSPYTKTNPFTSSSTKDILTTYRQAYWCKYDSDTPPSANCVTNDAAAMASVSSGYPYPNSTYKYRKTKDNGAPYYYVATSGSLAWCSDKALTSCQSTRTSTYKYPKVSAEAATPAANATASITFTEAGSSKSTFSGTINSIVVDGHELLAGAVTVSGKNSAANREKAAADVAASINSGTGTHGFSASAVSNSVVITAPASPSYEYWNGKSISYSDSSKYIDASLSNFANGENGSTGGSGLVLERVDIVSSDNEYTKYADRDDCAGTTCTYQEELQNFANWYSYYRTRMQMMKTAVSRAFVDVSDTAPGAGFRIGFDVISNSSSNLTLDISEFDPTHKTDFYTKLFAVSPRGYTPLRAALSKAGRLYAGRLATDPVQYTCQQNFTFLTSDGYWNTNAETSSYGPYKEDGSTSVGDQDGSSSGVSPPYKDGYDAQSTLADVAMYYYNHDLRSDLTPNDVPTSSRDAASYQHMVTFTMGLGMDGLIRYSPDYESGGSADYNAIVQGTMNWPNPITNSSEERVDDMWHAAVNGRGKYFSASDAQTVADSLNEALSGVSAMTGSAAAAATSNLEPVAGDNYAYVASYVTQTWEGNLEAKEIDLVTGELSSSSIWDARTLLDSKAAETTTPSGASGPGSRTLYSFDSSATTTDKKFLLTWANVSTLGWGSYFDPAQLNQCSPISFCPGATNENLFAYLMGGADTTTNGSYRERVHVLGDIVSSQPLYVKTPPFSYNDDGYSAFKSGLTRKAMVYVGANDGFLHAFDASNGVEDWAYMPSMLAPSLYELANSNYTHRYFVDGVVVGGDVKVGSNWKTILVGGLGGGGKGYYALDVTDPTSPLALWEFTDARMGYTYGNPVITKLPYGATSSGGTDLSGKWVVIVTSGYNNGTSLGSHDGQGVLYVLDAYDGTEYFRVYTCDDQNNDSTCAGSSSSPIGLAKINNWVDDSFKDNTTQYVYGGDLEGNLWRFDLKAKSAFKVAEIGEPITVKPGLAEIQGKRVIYFGTGLFLQASDKSDRAKRSIYAIKDDPSASGPLRNVKTSGDLVEQVLVASSNGDTRTMSVVNTVDWNTQSGCFVELLEDGERVNMDPKLQLGTLVVASSVPDETTSSSCSTGGHSWLNFLDVSSCSYVVNEQSNPDNIASVKLANALNVGVNVIKLPNGKLIAITTTSDNQHPVRETPVGTSGLSIKRVSWRELVNE